MVDLGILANHRYDKFVRVVVRSAFPFSDYFLSVHRYGILDTGDQVLFEQVGIIMQQNIIQQIIYRNDSMVDHFREYAAARLIRGST